MAEKLNVFKQLMLFGVFIWSALLLFFLINDIYQHKNYAFNLALHEARISVKKDLAYRSWVSSHGGVYVPITKRTPPNPYLAHLSDRDIETTTGKKLTLMNPAYILSQMMKDYGNNYGIKGHITSKKLTNPNNEPDQWELKGLEIIDQTEKPFFEKTSINNQNFLRYLNPLITKKSCLKCHAFQGYKVGDIRGAVSVSIPMQTYEKEAMSHTIQSFIYLFIIWLIGIIAILWGYKKSLDYVKQQVKGYEQHIYSLVDMIEKRDSYTAGHSQRVAKYSVLIAQQMGYNNSKVDQLYRAAMLHDIGKISTPDSILLKPGKLLKLEYSLIQEHVTSGYELLKKVNIFEDLAEIVRHHHEHYDGSGYPQGLTGDQIPIQSQIMTVADSFDAMTTDRVYKGRKTIAMAIDELKHLAGQQFHSDVVNAAVICLKNIEISHTENQRPHTRLEQERFAYFYKDSISGAYNREYLEFTLSQQSNSLQNTSQQNKKQADFKCIYAIYLHNFSLFNKNYGWHEGDKLLHKVATKLQELCPDGKVFRIFGDDFVVMHKEHKDINDKIIQLEAIIKNTGVEISFKHINLKKQQVDSIEKLEMFL
ncbi:MAG: DUF3365 domain-containing protein [Pseudomonadota bacterium]